MNHASLIQLETEFTNYMATKTVVKYDNHNIVNVFMKFLGTFVPGTFIERFTENYAVLRYNGCIRVWFNDLTISIPGKIKEVFESNNYVYNQEAKSVDDIKNAVIALVNEFGESTIVESNEWIDFMYCKNYVKKCKDFYNNLDLTNLELICPIKESIVEDDEATVLFFKNLAKNVFT